MMSKQVTLTINGNQVSVPEGTLVADAAKMVGIDIPLHCYPAHDRHNIGRIRWV
jgi:NADH-quinone oxidoreductase subunit G